MSNPSRAKGTAWESLLVPLLRAVWPSANRAPLWGSADRGDFTGTGPFCFEAKAHKQIDLAGFMDQAVLEANYAGARWPVVLVKRRNRPPSKGYAVMEIGTFLELVENPMTQEDDR